MSSVTPKASPRRIKWAPKNFQITVAVFVIALLIGAIVFFLEHLKSTPISDYMLRTESQTYALDSVRTSADMERGLGGRSSMAASRGMIFVYDTQDKRCFWMKDMRFSLDIIWVGSNRRITSVQSGLEPNTYPKEYCATAQYVIELNSGQAAVSGMHSGQKLNF